MIRRAALLGLLLLAACGGEDEPARAPSGSSPSVSLPDAAPPPGGFRLEVAGPGTPGARPPVTLVGDPDGVEIAVRRAGGREEVLDGLEDPSALPANAGEEVWRGPARAAPGGGLPALRAGLYLLEASRGETTVRAPLVVADLRIFVRRSPREMLVFVADATSGRPAPAAGVVVLGEGRRTEGATDTTGVWRTAIDPGPDARIFVSGEAGVGLARAGPVTTGSGPPTAVLLTDRDAARPGRTVRFAAVLGDRGAAAEAVRLADGSGSIVAEAPTSSSGPGLRTGAIRIPRGVVPGPGELVSSPPPGSVSTRIELDDGVRPPVRVAVDVPSRAVRGDDVPVRLRARWPGGVPAAGAVVRYRVVRETPGDGRPTVPSLAGEGRPDGEGSLATAFSPDSPGPWVVEGVLRDPAAGEVPFSARVEVAPAAFDLELEPVRGFVDAGSEVRFRVSRSDGGPVSGTVRLGEEERAFAVAENGAGAAEVSFPAPAPGPARATASAGDAAGRIAKATAEVYVLGEGAPPAKLRVIAERSRIEPGEKARFLVLVPFELAAAARIELVEGTELGAHAVVPTDGAAPVVELPAPAGLGERVRFLVALVQDGRVHRAAAEIGVAGRSPGAGPTILAPAEAEPGREVAVRLMLRNAEGVPAAGRLAVRAVADDGSPLLFEPRVEVPAAGLPLALTIPDGAREVRILAVAGGRELRIARARIRVRPVPATIVSAPARLVAGDVAAFRIAALNPGPDAAPATLGLEVENLRVMGRAEASALVAPGGRLERSVTVSAPRPGPARARAAGLGRAEEVSFDVAPAGSAVAATAAGLAPAGRSAARLDLPADAAAREAPLTIRLSASPTAAVALALPELVAGPPGDAEDLLAVVGPALDLSRRLEAAGVEPPPEATAAVAAARSALARLPGFANSDGGFGGGPGGSDAGATARVLVRLAELGEEGPTPDTALVRRAIGFVRDALAGGLVERDPAAAAAAVLALATRGVEPGPAVGALEERQGRLPDGARADLAGALLALGLRVRASAVLDGLEASERTDARGGSRWGVADPVRETAAVVRALLASPDEGRGALAERGVRFLLDARRGAGWGSALRTGAACRALLDADRNAGPRPETEVGCRIRVGPAIAASFRIGPEELSLTGRAVSIPPGFLLPGGNRIAFELSGGSLSWSARSDAFVPRETHPEESRGLRVSRRLWRIGEGPALAPLDGAVPLGTPIVATVRIESEAAVRHVRVVCPLPAGAVPIRVDPAAIDPALATPGGSRVEIADGRAFFFLPELPAGETRLAVMLRAAWSGKYTALPAVAARADDAGAGSTSGAETLYVE